ALRVAAMGGVLQHDRAVSAVSERAGANHNIIRPEGIWSVGCVLALFNPTVAPAYAGHVTGPSSFKSTSVRVRSGNPSGLDAERRAARFMMSRLRMPKRKLTPYAPFSRPGNRSRL